jgi:hypothetical protein
MENTKKVTEKEIIEQTKTISTYKWSIGLLVGVMLIVLGAFVTENQASKAELKLKASFEYVDKQDAKMREERLMQIQQLNQTMTNIQGAIETQSSDIKQILREMPRK